MRRLYPPGHEPIVLFSRMMGISSPARSGMNPFFKLKDSEVDEVRIKLPPYSVGEMREPRCRWTAATRFGPSGGSRRP